MSASPAAVLLQFASADEGTYSSNFFGECLYGSALLLGEGLQP